MVVSIVPSGLPHDASPQSITRADPSPGQQTFPECRSSCCSESGTGMAASSAHQPSKSGSSASRRALSSPPSPPCSSGIEPSSSSRAPSLSRQRPRRPLLDAAGQHRVAGVGQRQLSLGVLGDDPLPTAPTTGRARAPYAASGRRRATATSRAPRPPPAPRARGPAPAPRAGTAVTARAGCRRPFALNQHGPAGGSPPASPSTTSARAAAPSRRPARGPCAARRSPTHASASS